MSWKQVNLHGASAIARVCGIYEITAIGRVPGAKFKIKVLETRHGYVAVPNLATKSNGGSPEWISGLGNTELEALQDSLARMMSDLTAREEWSDDELEWSDPHDF